MHPFHHDRRRYFDIQVANARKSIIPFIASIYPLPSSARILEIGCGEGGLLKAFAENGHTAIGIEIEEGRVRDGISLMEEEIQAVTSLYSGDSEMNRLKNSCRSMIAG